MREQVQSVGVSETKQLCCKEQSCRSMIKIQNLSELLYEFHRVPILTAAAETVS